MKRRKKKMKKIFRAGLKYLFPCGIAFAIGTFGGTCIKEPRYVKTGDFNSDY